MGEPVRTQCELYVERLLRYLNIPHLINQVLCFQCRSYFQFNSDSIPSCRIGLHAMTRGQFARPDFVLEDKRAPMPVREPCKFSVLRVDGGYHDKVRQIKKDRGQERSLRDLNIPFFVSDNDFWKWEDVKTGKSFTPDPWRLDYKKIPARHLDYLVSIWNQTLDENLYKRFLDLKEIKDSRLI